MSFKKINATEVGNAFKLIGKDWMLITASDGEGVNTMTASWGCMGELWNKPVCVVFIRPQRYTFEFTEVSDEVTLSFFGGEYREALTLCGRKSGRDLDKIAASGLTLVDADTKTPFFDEAKLVIKGKKLYGDFLKKECFISEEGLAHYKANDFHKFYVYEVTEVLERE